MKSYLLENNHVVEKATISVTHPALLSGDGLFTTFLIQEGKAYFLNDHIERLKLQSNSLRLLFQEISLEALKALVKKNKAYKGSYRAKILLLPESPFLSSTNKKRRVEKTIVFLEPYQRKEAPLSLCLFNEEVQVPTNGLKTLSYLHRHFIMAYALQRGFDDALVSYKGALLESAFANFFWIDKETFFYPPKTLPYLLGITLHQILEVAKSIGLYVVEKKTTLEDLNPNCSVFLSNALMGVSPIRAIENGIFTRNLFLEKKLQESFLDLCQRKAISLI